jgi:hypothetical protein
MNALRNSFDVGNPIPDLFTFIYFSNIWKKEKCFDDATIERKPLLRVTPPRKKALMERAAT